MPPLPIRSQDGHIVSVAAGRCIKSGGATFSAFSSCSSFCSLLFSCLRASLHFFKYSQSTSVCFNLVLALLFWNQTSICRGRRFNCFAKASFCFGFRVVFSLKLSSKSEDCSFDSLNFFLVSPAHLSLKMSITPLFLVLITLHFTTSFSSTAQQTLNIHPQHYNPKLPARVFTTSNKFEGSSDLVHLRYHMGPVLSSPININIIWYGKWAPQQKLVIKDFLLSISANHREAVSPSVSDWWSTVSLYADQTNSNVSRSVLIAGEYVDHLYSQGTHLTRLTIQQVIANAVKSAPFPVNHKNGIYLILTSSDVTMQDFCRAVCGFHYFTFPSLVGYTLPYAWVGNSGKQCPEVCAYPFAVPGYMGKGGPGALTPPNGDVGVDGMISVIAHELAELASNPLVNAWYAGEDPTAPTEIGDLCEGLYGTGGGGGYIGQVMKDRVGRTFNLNGRRSRKFLVQWIWSPIMKACAGPNALD